MITQANHAFASMSFSAVDGFGGPSRSPSFAASQSGQASASRQPADALLYQVKAAQRGDMTPSIAIHAIEDYLDANEGAPGNDEMRRQFDRLKKYGSETELLNNFASILESGGADADRGQNTVSSGSRAETDARVTAQSQGSDEAQIAAYLKQAGVDY